MTTPEKNFTFMFSSLLVVNTLLFTFFLRLTLRYNTHTLLAHENTLTHALIGDEVGVVVAKLPMLIEMVRIRLKNDIP